MSKSLRFIAANLVAALISCTAFAQSVTIKGSVTNSTSKEGVPAVSVTIKGTSQGTYTDDKGMFSISTTSKFPLTLSLSSVGFESKEVNVNSASDALDISFVEISTLGQEVVMAANRTPQRILESPVTVERLSSSALRNAAVPSYYEAIANLKGVDMHTASLTFRTVTTRGFVSSGNNRMNQLIDGMDNQAPGLNFSVGNIVGLTELDVDNIELLSGASSALYGSGGMNGTLLLNSKNPFKYTGLSFNVKQGIMHVDGSQRKASPYYNWSMRWAKNINNKLALKFAWELLKAEDWQANDTRNVLRFGIPTVKDGNRITDPNYDGINVYGDEISNKLDFGSIATGAQAQYQAGIAAASGGYYANVVDTLNKHIPLNSTFTGINTALTTIFSGPFAGLIPTVQQMLPFYWGLRNNWYQNGVAVSRTGYNERDLVDYGSLNFKFTAGLHYKITPGIEASWNTYWGTGTTVYTGADRYSLRNFKMAQHRLEIRHKNWFLRGYTTQENAGEAYNASALGALMQQSFKDSRNVWYPQYVTQYFTYAWTNFATTNNAPSPFNAHASSRAVADAGMPLPGSVTFNALKEKIRSTPIGKGGAKFLDKSDLWAGEGQLNISDALGFSDKLEVMTGVQWKQWVMNSQGTIFADTAGSINVSETGGYMQLRKKLFNEILTLTGAIRYDKQTNFDGRWTPRFTAVIKVAKDHNFRTSFQTAYRFPTNQDQYINLNTGTFTLIGCLPQFINFYGLNTNTYEVRNGILSTSQVKFSEVKPESVASGEIGYKGLIKKKLLVDFYAYYSRYKDFFARVAVIKDPTTTPRTFGIIQNSPDIVKASGWGLGLEYLLPKGFIASGNIYSDKLTDLPAGFVSFFNAPKYRFNLGLRNDNIYKNIGFNITSKWQDETVYEGTFIQGLLPSVFWVDAQVSYKMPKSKSLIRIGGSNLGNTYRRTGFGSPYIGGLYYISYGYNL